MNQLGSTQITASSTSRFRAYISWFIASFFFIFQFFLQTATSVMSDFWAQDFHLNAVELSNLSASFFYSFVLLQIPVGILYDKFKAKNILVIAAILLALGCFMLGLVHGYTAAMLARILMGIGSAFGFLGLLKVIINNFTPNKFALMLGFTEAISMTLITFGIILLAAVLQNYSWRTAMLVCGVFAVLLVFAIIFFIEEKGGEHKPVNTSFAGVISQVKELMLNKQLILCSIYSFFIFSIINAFASLWGVTFITHIYGFSHTLASSMVSIVFIGLALGGPLNGWLAKTFENQTRILVYGSFFGTIVMVFIILVPGLSKIMLFILLCLSGVFCSLYVQALSVVKDSVNSTIQATALAIANTILMSSAPVLQLIIGGLLQNHLFGFALTEAANYRCALAILPLGMFVALILSFYIKQPVKYVGVHNTSNG